MLVNVYKRKDQKDNKSNNILDSLRIAKFHVGHTNSPQKINFLMSDVITYRFDCT